MLKNKKTINETVGIDIGNHSVKIVSISKSAEIATLTAYHIKQLLAKKDPSGIKDTIKSMLDEVNIFPETVNLSLSGPDIIVRFINLPKMRKDQLENALAYEAEKYIPFNVNEVILDSIILGDIAGRGQMKVLLAAGKRDFILERVKIMEELGIGVGIMDVTPFAMYNAFINSHEVPPDKVCAFLNIGSVQTDVLIFTGDIPCFTRQIQLGGKNITDILMAELSLAEAEAEKKKIYPEESDKETVRRAASRVMKDLIEELHLSFGYFENRYNKKVDTIYCTGGSVTQDDMVSLLEEHIGTNVKKWDPIGEIKLAETISEQDIVKISSQLAIAIGLALRE